MGEKISDKVQQEIFEGYGGEEQRLYSYATLMGLFNLIFAVFLLFVKGTERYIPERVDTKDLALLGVATHKLSLIGAQDAVTSSLRAPFTELREKESPRASTRSPGARGLDDPWVSS